MDWGGFSVLVSDACEATLRSRSGLKFILLLIGSALFSHSPRGQLIGHHDPLIRVGHEQPQRVLQYILDEIVALLHFCASSLSAAQLTFDLLALLR